MTCEWNTVLDGFKDPFKIQDGDCPAPATITIGRHPWAFVCEKCVKSSKLKGFMKRSMSVGGTAASEMHEKCETAGTRDVIRRRRVEN